MKKIVVMSDNHGNDDCLDRIKELENNANYYIHCGDSEATSEQLASFYAVRGNNDWYNDKLRDELVLTIDGVGIYVCHGHRAGYLNRLENISALAKHNQCQIALFGHTHVPLDEVVNGVRIINPGSTSLPRGGSKPSYAVIIINEGNIEVSIKSFH